MSQSNVHRALSPACAAAVQDVRYHSVASLAFLIWNSIVTFDSEVEYIWPMRNSSPFKWAYFFFRYFVTIAHIVHNIFMEPLANGTNHPIHCEIWWAYINSFSQILGTALEFILATRVFAFYNKSRRIGLLLLLLILTEALGGVRMLWLGRGVGFFETCLLMLGSDSNREQSIVVIACHCTLISLTMFKYFIALKAGWGRTPLVSLVIRDVSTVYALMFSLLISVFVFCRLNAERGVAVFFWFTALMSISGCRVVLGMERLARRRPPAPAEFAQSVLTSHFSMSTPGSV